MTDAEAVQWRGRLRRIQNDPEPFDTQTLGDVVLALLEAVLVLRDQVRTIGELATSAHLTAAEAGRVAREAMAEADRAVERVLEAGRRHSSGVLH